MPLNQMDSFLIFSLLILKLLSMTIISLELNLIMTFAFIHILQLKKASTRMKADLEYIYVLVEVTMKFLLADILWKFKNVNTAMVKLEE